jgi:hypothetical protein
MRTGGKTAEAAEKRKEKTMTNGGKLALFFGGALFGSAGLRILSGRDARKVYSHTTAAVLRCRDEIMKHVELVQEGCSDILADAKQINADREKEAEAEFIEESART